MSFARVYSAQISGLNANGVSIEIDISRGLFLFQIVGLPDKAVEEARERVLSALKNSIGKNPKTENQKVIVSLSPADIRKEGGYFDLGIAIGYLLATSTIVFDPEKKLFIGELGLNGEVRPIKGLLSIARWAKENGYTEIYIPKENIAEASLVDGINFFAIPTLADLVAYIKGEDNSVEKVSYSMKRNIKIVDQLDFADIKGQASAKRALLIAAAGGHNIVLYGPPGTGKTMLAKSFHSILPELTQEEFIEVATVYSSVGLVEEALTGTPPFRSPHHSASHVALIGGGTQLRPGEITMAHRGVLYLDEFPEFDRRVIEALREPLEDGNITVARAKGSARYPARFIFLGAMNPCPCGYRGSSVKVCTCSAHELSRYGKKLSGPIIDRIDIWVPVNHIDYETLHEKTNEKESPILKQKVFLLRKAQYEKNKKLNANLSSKEVQYGSGITESAKRSLQDFAEKLKLSPRAYIRTIKVARTIADLEGNPSIEVPHILEALQYRPKIEY